MAKFWKIIQPSRHTDRVGCLVMQNGKKNATRVTRWRISRITIINLTSILYPITLPTWEQYCKTKQRRMWAQTGRTKLTSSVSCGFVICSLNFDHKFPHKLVISHNLWQFGRKLWRKQFNGRALWSSGCRKSNRSNLKYCTVIGLNISQDSQHPIIMILSIIIINTLLWHSFIRLAL